MVYMMYEALTGKYAPHGELSDADVIVAPAFGRRPDDIGDSNEAIARYAIEKAEQYSMPIIAQFAVANAIEKAGSATLLEHRVDPRTPEEARYMNSDHILKRIAPIVGNRTAVIAAHGYHAARFDAQARRRGILTVLPAGLPAAWDKQNVRQEGHCNSPFHWAAREPLVILEHLVTGKL